MRDWEVRVSDPDDGDQCYKLFAQGCNRVPGRVDFRIGLTKTEEVVNINVEEEDAIDFCVTVLRCLGIFVRKGY